MKETNQAGISLNRTVWKGPSRSQIPVLLSDMLLVLLGLFGVAQCTASAFSISVKPIFLSCCIFLFSCLFLAVFSLKKWRFLLLLLLSAVYCGTAYLLRAYFLQGFVITTNQIFTALGDHSRFTFPQFRVDLPSSAYTSACTVFFTFVLFFLACYLCWAIHRRHSFWLSLFGTAPFLLVPLGFTITPALPAALMLLGFWATLLLSRLCANSSFGRTAAAARVSLVVLPAIAICLLLMTLLIPPDTYMRPAYVESLRKDLEGGIYGSSWFSSQNADFDRTDLNTAGNRHYTGQTVLRVKNPQKTPLYLHASSGSVYTGISWEPLPDSAYTDLENTLYFNPQNMAGQFLSFYALPEEQSLLTEIEVQNIAANRACLYAPYGLASRPEDLSNATFVHDAYIRAKSPFGLSNYSVQAWNVTGFSRPVDLERVSDPFHTAEQTYRSFIDTYYTQLPNNLREKLQWFCSQQGIPNAGNASQERIISAVAELVRSTGTYTLSPGVTPEGRDFVDYFLFESRKGYCVHYASTAVALLRAQGIPARYAEGYAVTAKDYGVDGWADIPDRRAHAWAEVYTPGLGWQPLEVTPGVQLSSGIMNEQNSDTPENASSTPESEPESSSSPDSSEPEPSSDMMESSSSSSMVSAPESGSLSAPFGVTAVTLLSIGGIVLLIALRRILVLKHREKRFHGRDANSAAIAVYAYLQDLASFGARIDPLAEELVLKAKFSQHLLTPAEMQILWDDARSTAKAVYGTLPAIRKLAFKYGRCLI